MSCVALRMKPGHRGNLAEHLLDRLFGQGRVIRQRAHLVGVLGQRPHGGREQVARGLGVKDPG